MSRDYASGLDSSYIWSLTSQLGTTQDASDQMTSFIADFRLPDGELLVDKSGPLSKEDEPIKLVTDDFLVIYGDIFWPSYSKDAKLRWSTDKERITDLVGAIYVEKFRLYKQKSTKDLNTDTKGSTPQPPPQQQQPLPPVPPIPPPPNNIAHESTVDTKESEATHDLFSNKLDSKSENPASLTEEEPATAAKQEYPLPSEQEDSSIHLLTSRNRNSARASASARTSEPAPNSMKQSPPQSPSGNEDDDSNKPYKFLSEAAYRQGIIDALERAKARGGNLVGAIQFVRTTLNETVIRDAISSASSTKKIGTVRLTQINERTMAWVFEKLDGSCLWVKPYKGKVINSVVRYSGWTGEDNVFTDYPVTYGIIPRDPETPGKVLKDSSSPFKSRSAPRLSGNNPGSKMVNLKIGRRQTDGKADSPTSAPNPEFPAYIHGDSWTMERAKAAVKMGHLSLPPCGFCVDAGYDCMMADRGRTCAFCIATNRSATICEGSRQMPRVDTMDYESSIPPPGQASPTTQPILTHSGRVSKRPTRDNYVDRSENESDSAVSSGSAEEPVRGPGNHKLRRKSSALRSTPSLKRQRPDSLTATDDYDYAPPSASATGHPNSGALTAPLSTSAFRPRDAPEAWFYFTPATPSNPESQSKVVRARELVTVHAFFDTALKAWKTFGGSSEPTFGGVDVSWSERKMLVEWRDERDWERMMTMLGRAQGDEHGEVEVNVKYRIAG